MKSPILLSELLMSHLGASKDSYPKETYRRDRPYPADEVNMASEQKISQEKPGIFHVSVLLPMHEVRAWIDQGYISVEKDVMAYSPDDAIRQLAIQVTRK
jgi:hypothetical protein